MANFNAGAIEATLTLDRSDFIKELREAQAQAKNFEKEKIKIAVELGSVTGELKKLEAQVKAADPKVDVAAKVSGEEAIAKLKAMLQSVSDQTVTIDVKADANGEIRELRAKLKAIPDETVNIKVDTDEDSTSKIMSSSRALNGMRFAIAGVAGILPAFVPAVAGATAVVAALAGAAGIAGLGLGAFALVAIPALKGLSKALKDAKGDISKLPPEMQKLAEAQDRLKQTQETFGQSAGVYTTLAAGYDLINTVLSKLEPVIANVSGVLYKLILMIDEWAKSPAFDALVSFMNEEFGPTFLSLAAIMGNLITTFGGLVRAFQPFTKELLGGLVSITEGWSKWAASLSTSEKFQKFLDYVRETGPKVAALFVSVGAALINIGKALAPIGGGVLDVLIGFFDFIAKADPGILGGILVGVATAIVLFQAWTAAIALWNLVMAANPIALVVIAIAALVAGLIYAYKNSETFRNIVNGVWNSIKMVIGAVVGWITGTMVPAIVGAWKAVADALKAVGQFFSDVWNGIKSVVSTVVNFIVTLVTTYFNIMKAGVFLVLDTLVSKWRAFWGIFGGVITAGMNLVKALWNLGFTIMLNSAKAVWNGIVAVIKVAINLAKNTISTVLNAIKLLVTTVWNGIKTITSTAWNVIKGAISTPINAAKTVVSGVVNGIKSVMQGVWNAIGGAVTAAWSGFTRIISEKINAAKNAVSSAISTIKGLFSGAGGWLYNAGRNVIQGFLSGLESMMNAVTSKLQWLTDHIPKVKGPEQRDKNLLKPAGRWIMGGLIGEISNGIDEVMNMMDGLTDDISTGVTVRPVTLAASAGSGTAPAAVATATPLTKEDFISAMVELIREIRANTQPLIGEYHDAHKDPREIAEEWWFTTKGRGI